MSAQQLDSDSAFLQGGIRYNLSGVDNLKFMVKLSETHYTNLSAYGSLSSGLAEYFRQVTYQVFYDRTLSQKLDFLVMAGLAEIPGSSGAGDDAKWRGNVADLFRFTDLARIAEMDLRPDRQPLRQPPRLGHRGSAGVPRQESLAANYSWTPKINLSATISRSEVDGSTGAAASAAYYGANTVVSESLKASYQWTPFTSASLSLRASDRTYTGEHVTNDTVMLGLDYQPY